MSAPRITVVMPLYRAAQDVPALVAALAAQEHPDHAEHAEWLEALLVDNASDDGTAEAVRHELEAHGNPPSWRLIENPENLGLARSLNRALGMTHSPFVLTCHADCRFVGPHYVADMLRLLERTPDAGAITGKPEMPPEALSLVERVYAIANLMDVLPTPQEAPDLVPVGFSEGRCDGFRMDALRAVGMYGQKLRLAGEDQVISAQMRAAGYEVYQAPHLRYRLSVSAMQDSLGKLVALQRRFGRVNPTILLANRGTRAGVAGRRAGANRRARTMLRTLEIAGAAAIAGGIAGALLRRPVMPWIGLGAAALGAKAALARPYAQAVGAGPADLATWAALQPAIDAAFCLGLAEGGLALATGRDVW